MTRHVIKSDALDAFRAKSHYAERVIGRHFVAFVRAPATKKGPRGFVFYGTDNHLASYSTSLFHALIVGSPDEKVKEVRSVIKYLHEQTAELTSNEDVHGSVIVDMLKDFNQVILEDKEEPRPNSAETLIFDARGHLYWIAYSGQHGGQEIRCNRRAVILRGCYDKAVNRQIRQVLNRCRNGALRKARLKLACTRIRQLTRLHTVSYVLIP